MESKTRRTWWIWGTCVDMPERDVRNLRRFTGWALVWAIAFVVATWLLTSGAIASGALSFLVAAIPTCLGLVVVWAYVRYLREADELQRKIHLEALALGFGAGAVFMMGYRLFERAGAPALDMNDALVVMLVVWSVWQGVAARRYV